MNKFIILFCSVSILFFACEKEATKEEVTTTGPMEILSFNSSDENGPNIVLITGDEEYRSEEALPQLAKILSSHHPFNTKVLFAQEADKKGIVSPNHHFNIPGLEALEDADLMIIFTRFRALPDEQMAMIDAYLKRGGPVIGIRTATHAFRFKDTTHQWKHYGNFYEGPMEEWKGGFGRVVLGEKWISHHGHHKHQSTRGRIAEDRENHPILTDIEDGAIWGPTDVYGVRLPMQETVTPLVLGEVVNRAGEYDESDPFYGMKESDTEIAMVNPARKEGDNPNAPMMPIAWLKSYQIPGGKAGTAFASTIGSSTDMVNEAVRRMYVNACYFLLDMDVPSLANVSLLGGYNPTAYAFQPDSFWIAKDIHIDQLK